MPLDPLKIRAVDMEASGLHPTSYPIQLGWTGLDLKPRSLFIKRAESWGDDDWDLDSEKVHGISRQDLASVGIPASDAARIFLESTEGMILISDNPSYETRWMSNLMIEAGYNRMPIFESIHAAMLDGTDASNPDPIPFEIIEEYIWAVRTRYPHTHKADDDSLSLAAYMKCIYEPAFREQFREIAEARHAEAGRQEELQYLASTF